MTPASKPTASDDLHELAYGTISRVLGRDRAAALLPRLLDELGIELRSPQDLLRLSERMVRLGGFEGAVGAMIGVSAVMRGATPAAR